MRCLCLGLLLSTIGLMDAACANPPEASPGPAIDYLPIAFYPERWKEQGQDAMLYPWQGKRIVFLTAKNDLDRQVMGVFLDRLDGAWQFYEEIMGRSPRRFKQLKGQPTIAAVPDAKLTCGYGCGFVGVTGIEVSAFDRVDFPLVKKNPKAFPHYYFYEMGRNFFLFGHRHSSFTTGFAVFMRYAAMDALKCEDPDAATRRQIEQAIDHYAKTDLAFLQGFTLQGGMDEKAPRLGGVPGPSDQPVIYASAMLKLRRELGGDEWVKRCYRELLRCPEVNPNSPQAALRQSLMWLVAASVAARKDLSPIFVDEWRFPMGEQTRQAMSKIPWDRVDLSAPAVLDKLPRDPTH